MITLELRKDSSKNGIGFGINVYEDGRQIESIADISENENQVSEFVDLCNRSNVEAVHLYDLLEDFF